MTKAKFYTNSTFTINGNERNNRDS